MCRKIFAVISFCLFSLPTFAKTSAEIRAEKIVSFSINSGNSGVSFADIGPSISFFVKPWFSAGLSYRYNFLNPVTRGALDSVAKEDNTGLLSALLKSHTHHYFSLDAKFHTGDTFYIKTGLGYDILSLSKEAEYIRSSAFIIPI